MTSPQNIIIRCAGKIYTRRCVAVLICCSTNAFAGQPPFPLPPQVQPPSLEDSAGTLWVGTLEDSAGTLWVGTVSGLAWLNSGRFQPVGERTIATGASRSFEFLNCGGPRSAVVGRRRKPCAASRPGLIAEFSPDGTRSGIPIIRRPRQPVGRQAPPFVHNQSLRLSDGGRRDEYLSEIGK